jgi:hypothetical protein
MTLMLLHCSLGLFVRPKMQAVWKADLEACWHELLSWMHGGRMGQGRGKKWGKRIV